jgi:CHAT domain-containing protein
VIGRVGLAGALLVAACARSAAGAAVESFADCDGAVARAPSSYESFFCYYRVAVRDAAWTRAAARLDRLGARYPDSGWPLLVRGFVARVGLEETERVAALYEQALARFTEQGNARGEVMARTNLHTVRLEAGDGAAAAEHVARALEAAQASGDREALARASLLEAKHLVALGTELGKAHRALRRAHDSAFPEGPFGVQQLVLELLASVAFQLRRYEEAAALSERLLDLKQRVGTLESLSALRYNVANARLVQEEARPRPDSIPRLRELFAEVLRSAVDEGEPVTMARAHALLGDLWSEEAPSRAEEHYGRCLGLIRGLEDRTAEMHCLWAQAKHLAARRPTVAMRAVERAARIAIAAENDLWATYVWQAQLRTLWHANPAAAAGEASMALLDAIERLRRSQADAASRIGVFANWTADYYWLAGRLLGSDPPQLGRAFDVSERLRSRVLLETLEAAGIGARAPPPEAQRLAETRTRIVGVQRQLLDPALDRERRSSLLAELERLEVDESILAAPLAGARRDPRLATLAEVRQRLAPDEAMLVFLVGLDRDLYGRPAGGSWAVAVTHDGVNVRRIPGRLLLEAAVPLFNGLLERRDGSEGAAAAALHAQLLGETAAGLGPAIRRLVVVPDGVLHELPFAALRPGPGADPLGARYELAVAPSATLWARWTSRARVHPPAAALVVAAPELASHADGVALERGGGVLSHAPALPPLAYAEREGIRIRRTVGGASELLTGPAAAETALKAADLRRFGLLHLATHALADDEYPDRSAVLLAPGSDSEDGLLQPREISMLDLEGRAVVLSACHTAAGRVVSGEGVLSLSRAFFEGGARTIVASYRALRDDETEKLMSWFYADVARGRSLGSALQTARRRALAEGLPAAAWSAVFLMGDPDFSWPPTRGGRRWAWAAGGLLICVLAAVGLRAAARAFRRASGS